jgi:hypothetical protein
MKNPPERVGWLQKEVVRADVICKEPVGSWLGEDVGITDVICKCVAIG